MRFVSEVEWELLKHRTSVHLNDRNWPYRPPKIRPIAIARRPIAPPSMYFSGNYPGMIAD